MNYYSLYPKILSGNIWPVADRPTSETAITSGITFEPGADMEPLDIVQPLVINKITNTTHISKSPKRREKYGSQSGIE